METVQRFAEQNRASFLNQNRVCPVNQQSSVGRTGEQNRIHKLEEKTVDLCFSTA